MKILSICLAFVVLLLGYSNYQQGNKIAELYIVNAELKTKLKTFTELELPSDKRKALAQEYSDIFTAERPPETELKYSDSFDDIPTTNKKAKTEE